MVHEVIVGQYGASGAQVLVCCVCPSVSSVLCPNVSVVSIDPNGQCCAQLLV